MKLKVGNTYEDRLGDVTTIIACDEVLDYEYWGRKECYRNCNDETWDEDGSYRCGSTHHIQDLVKPVGKEKTNLQELVDRSNRDALELNKHLDKLETYDREEEEWNGVEDITPIRIKKDIIYTILPCKDTVKKLIVTLQEYVDEI